MTEPTSRRKVWHRVIQIVVTIIFLAFLVYALAGRWSEVKDVIGNLTIRALMLSLLASLLAIWCTFMPWRAILADFGHAVPVTGGLRIFFVGQLAKYLPGKVWPVVTQMRLGRAYHVPGRSSAAAVLIAMLMGLGTALLITACCLPILGGSAFAKYWWILLVLPLSIVVLWPGVLNALLNRATKLLKREPMPQPLTARGIARSALRSIAGWLMFGASLWILLIDLGAFGPDLIVRACDHFLPRPPPGRGRPVLRAESSRPRPSRLCRRTPTRHRADDPGTAATLRPAVPPRRRVPRHRDGADHQQDPPTSSDSSMTIPPPVIGIQEDAQQPAAIDRDRRGRPGQRSGRNHDRVVQTGCIRPGSPFRTGPPATRSDLEGVTSAWVYWYNTAGLMHRLGRRPPAEAEAEYYTIHDRDGQPAPQP